MKAGSVKGISITPDGQAKIKFSVDGAYAPLPARHAGGGSPGVAVRLRQPLHRAAAAAAGRARASRRSRTAARLTEAHTVATVDIDQLFNTLDPSTRKALQDFFKGSAAQYRDVTKQANAGLHYLNPALATSSRVFNELNRDTPVLEHFLGDSAAPRHRRGPEARRPRGPRPEPEHHHARDRQPEGRAGRLDRPAAGLHAQRQHHVREPARGAERRRPAGERLEAGGEEAQAVPRPGAAARARRASDGRGPQHGDPRRRLRTTTWSSSPRRSRRSRTSRWTPRSATARAARARSRSRTTALKGSAPIIAFRPSLHAGPLRLVRRLLDHGRLRRARPDLAHADRVQQHLGRHERAERRSAWAASCRPTGAASDRQRRQPVPGRPPAEALPGRSSRTQQFSRCPGGGDVVAPDKSNLLSSGEQQALGCTERTAERATTRPAV